MKKRSERRKNCALAVVRRKQKFRPTTDPLPGGAGRPNLISWRWSLPLPINSVWWRSMHAISSYRGNRRTNTQTHRQDRLQYTTPLSLARSVISRKTLKQNGPCRWLWRSSWPAVARCCRCTASVPWRRFCGSRTGCSWCASDRRTHGTRHDKAGTGPARSATRCPAADS